MIKNIFVLITLTLMLLAGCNSEVVPQPPVDATLPYLVLSTLHQVPQPPVDATVIEIAVTPSPISVLEGRTQQLVAMAKYNDESEIDVSNSVMWTIVGDPTIADVSASGLLTGNTKGETELTASKDGITSNTVNVNVCDLAGVCIDIFDTGSGKLFTNSPSEAYLDSIGDSATNGTYTENGTSGPSGDFYRFNWDNANALCDAYNEHSLGGRTNWRLATRDELKMELYDVSGNMFTARGWPAITNYWSATSDGSIYYLVNLYNGIVFSYYPSNTLYASCFSNP